MQLSVFFILIAFVILVSLPAIAICVASLLSEVKQLREATEKLTKYKEKEQFDD